MTADVPGLGSQAGRFPTQRTRLRTRSSLALPSQRNRLGFLWDGLRDGRAGEDLVLRRFLWVGLRDGTG